MNGMKTVQGKYDDIIISIITDKFLVLFFFSGKINITAWNHLLRALLHIHLTLTPPAIR